VRLRRLVTKNDFPRYAMKVTRKADGAEAVHFIARHYLESRGQTIESKGGSIGKINAIRPCLSNVDAEADSAVARAKEE
jgi:hypothetical protein